MVIKKNLVLNGVKNTTQRAVLSIECDGTLAKGKLRLYNFGAEPMGIISLGIYQKGNVVKAGLIKSSHMLYTFACQLDKIENDFSCAVINIVEGEANPILYGKGEGYVDAEEIFGQVFEELNSAKNVEEIQETLDNHGIDFDDELKNEIEEKIDECLKEDGADCENCIYKKYYDEHITSQILENHSDEVLEEEDDEGEYDSEAIEQSFYEELKPQIDKLFANNPSEEYLENLIPQSKWVKVNIDENGNYYVLGLIYDDNKLKYICYGVPGVYQKNAPRELSGFPVWFPLDQAKPEGFGYWLSYQDADNGESVKAMIV